MISGVDATGLARHFFRREFGFPHWPGLLDRALREFPADGLRLPWLSGRRGQPRGAQPGRRRRPRRAWPPR